MTRSIRAFTLIELLVVITIIVVLLALLTPALDNAVYQAQLAVCGANLHATANGTLTYAAGNRRHYPDREGPDGWDHHKLSSGGQPYRFDDRPLLRSYLKLNGHLRCPLTARVDLDLPGANTGAYSSYSLWFDWRYVDKDRGEKGMHRLGDRFTWSELGRTSSFSVLAGDWVDDDRGGDYAVATHPSKDGLMTQLVYDDAPSPWIVDPTNTVQGNVAFSWWVLPDSFEHGPMDMNFAFDDGSVRRVNDVEYEDPRLVHVPRRPKDTTTEPAERRLKLPGNGL